MENTQVILIVDIYDITKYVCQIIHLFIKFYKIESVDDLKALFERLRNFADGVMNISSSHLCISNIAKRLQKVIRDQCEKLNISFNSQKQSLTLTRLDSTINVPMLQLTQTSTTELSSASLTDIKEELKGAIKEIKNELIDTKQSIIDQADENIFQNETILVYGYSDTLVKFFHV